MELTKNFLSNLGIENEKIEQIINAHKKDTDALKTERDNYKTNAEKFEETQKKLDMAEKKLTENEDFKKQFEELRGEISAKETTEKKSGAMRKILREKGYSEKGIEKILKYGNYHEKTEFDENFNVKNIENFIKNVESEWSEFKPVETKTFNEPPTPPKSTTNNNTKSEVSQYAEAYYNRLYGAKKED